MKKVLKIALLLLAASIFFAGCSNSSGGSSDGSGGSKGKTNSSSKMPQFDLSDGDWDMDIHQYSKVIVGGTPNEVTSVEHIEMTIAGEDVTVTKATRKMNNGPEEDTTAEWNASLKNAKEAGNISAFAEDDSSSSSSAMSGIDPSVITPTVTYDENNSDTYYKVTVVNSYKYYDLFEMAYGNNPQALAFFKAMFDPDDSVYQKMEVVYTKK